MAHRIAIVDMGTNSLKFSVTEVDSTGAETIINARADTIRLGAGIETTGVIDPVRAQRAIDALVSYEQVAKSLGAEALIGVATAAFRMANNRFDLLGRIARTTDWKVSVISGAEEARLTFLGLAGSAPVHGTALIVDVGGGSTEVIQVLNRTLIDSESIPIGSGILSDREFTVDPPGMAAVTTAERYATSVIANSKLIGSVDRPALLLSGGNGQFLSQLAAWDEIDIPFTPSDFPRLLQEIASIRSEKTATFLNIPAERSRMLPAGGAIASAVIQLARPTTLQAVPSGIRGGLVAEWIACRQ
jgi:exopolyphosphatase/guanosine-5'-triphosphate,3'-diphosphate pyrophosphatase